LGPRLNRSGRRARTVGRVVGQANLGYALACSNDRPDSLCECPNLWEPERWTPVILRNDLDGCRTFNEIAGGAPGLSRSLLTKRLHELARAGLIDIRPKPDGHGSFYEPTPAARAAGSVLEAIAVWAENWADVRPEHSDPGPVRFTWCRHSLRHDQLPRRQIVVRFEFTQRGPQTRSWMLLKDGAGEICNFDPGFGDDLVVAITDALTFTRWHLGLTSWAQALRAGGVQVSGPPDLRRALPTWNAAPELAKRRRADYRGAPASDN
jgi:DNA-binding HxlR family transcriptional regulator